MTDPRNERWHPTGAGVSIGGAGVSVGGGYLPAERGTAERGTAERLLGYLADRRVLRSQDEH